MNCAYLLALLPVVSLFLIGCNGGSFETPRVGGYSAAEVNDQEIIAAAQFAVSEESKKGNALTLVSIDAAQRQIVAGMNYRLSLTVKDLGTTKKAEAVVYRDLDPKLSLTSWNWK